MKINWSKVWMDFYPQDLMKQFKKVSVPFYLCFGILLFYLIQNLHAILFSKVVAGDAVITFYFLFPIVYPLLILGLLLSSIHILRHNNPFILYYIGFKQLLVYFITIGLIPFCLFFFLLYFYFMNAVFKFV